MTEDPSSASRAEYRADVLYVDDDRVSGQLVKRNLERNPAIKVHLAEDGSEGLKHVIQNDYDLILLDNDMPEMGGLELLQELRKLEDRTPVIMITGAGDEMTAVKALKSGCRDYIIKDVENTFLHLLPVVIGQVLKQAEAERELERTNKENRRLLMELQQTNQHLKKSNDLKNEVLGIAAHDLKNPIGSILLSICMLLESERDPASEAAQMLDLCKTSCERALEVINTLLDSEGLELGDIKLYLHLQSLTQIAQDVLGINKPFADDKNISLKLLGDPRLMAEVDTFTFRQLVDNLVSNAIKYSPLDSTVTVRVFRDDGCACLAVRDEGPGFTEEDRRHLYQQYRRLSARPTANEPSTGVGLSIVKRYADLHHAAIQLNSAHGQGAEFIVKLPAAPAE